MAQMNSSIPKSNAFNFPVERKKRRIKTFFFLKVFFRYTKPMASFVCLHIASDNSWRSLSNAFLGVIHTLRTFREYMCGGHFLLTVVPSMWFWSVYWSTNCSVFFSFFLVDQKKIVQTQGIFGQSLGIFGTPKRNLVYQKK